MSLAFARSLFRQFVQRPALVVAATATLGVSIGAATAISSAVKAVLLGPLPIEQPERLAVLWQTDPKKGVQTIELSSKEYAAWRTHLTSFSGMAAVTAANIRNTLTGNPEPEQVESAIVSPNYFQVLGVRPRIGRDFNAQDARDVAGSNVLVSEGLWTRRYGSNPSLIGRTITVDGTPVTVIGVMPVGTLPRHADLFLNGTALAHDAPDLGVLKLVGRLDAGASLDSARAEVDLVAPRLTAVRPTAETAGGRLEPFTDQIYGQVRPALQLLTAAVTCLLLIACANVANLLLARGIDRERELATRAALGASPRRLGWLLVGESIALALAGGLCGALLAIWAIAGIRALIPADVPGVERLSIDGPVLAVATAISILSALAFGVVPAVTAARTDPGDLLRESGTRVSGGRRIGRLRSLLVAGQLALSLGLVTGAGLAARSFAGLARLEPGFDPRGVVTAKILLSDKYADHRKRAAFYRPLLERLNALPGVDRAALVLLRPLADPIGWDYPFTVEGQTPEAQARNPHANYESVSPGYFATLGIPLIEGRAFAEADGPDAGPVTIVSRSMAHRFWPGESAIGKRVKPGAIDGKGPWRTVVGVVGDVRYREWTAVREDIYVPYAQWNFPRMDLVLRMRDAVDPSSAIPSVRAAVLDADPDLPLATVTTLDKAVEEATAGPRFTAILLTILATVALVVAAVGTFSVLVWSVERRTREIGVRVALGASRLDVLHLVLGQATRLTGLGVAAGLLAALAAGAGLSRLLYAVSPRDPLTLVSCVLLLMAVGLGGGLLAARRALAIAPSEALREE
jgi:putative ABC transport system permease protein